MVWLCGACHVDVHGHPFDAAKSGWIVSRHVILPTSITVHTPLGERALGCDGTVVFRAAEFSPTEVEKEQP